MIKKKFIIKPCITEKTTKGIEKNKYCFLVYDKVNKIEIKKEIEKTYAGVSVLSVNTMIYGPKHKSRYVKNKGVTKFKTNKFKKAIVELKEGDSIDIYNN